MTIHPRDLPRLLIRVTLVAFAVRAVPLFSVDLDGLEVGAAHGLAAPDAAFPRALLPSYAFAELVGRNDALSRFVALLSDCALPGLAVVYTRAAGWGALPGLLAGTLLAMGPLGIDAGARADGLAWLPLLLLGALGLLRLGLRDGKAALVGASLLPLGALGWLTPSALAVVPGGLLLGLRSVTGPAPKWTALVGWPLVAAVAVLAGGGFDLATALDPGETLTASWQHGGAGLTDGGLLPGGLDAFGAAWAAWGPAGTTPGWAAAFGGRALPWWTHAVTVLLGLVALYGWFFGEVQPDPRPARSGGSHRDEGAAGRDGWQTLGVVQMMPRLVGERDWSPLVLVGVGSAVWVALACTLWQGHGAREALALGRPAAALALGLGWAAAGRPRSLDAAADPGLATRRFAGSTALVALAVFGLGSLHLYTGAADPGRSAARKVAHFAAEHVSVDDHAVCVGVPGAAVLQRLDPWGKTGRVHLVAPTVDAVSAALDEAVAPRGKPKLRAVALVGSQAAIDDGALLAGGPQTALLGLVEARLGQDGFALDPDTHRALGGTAVAVFERRDPLDRGTVRPQLAPGAHPDG